MCGFAGGYDLLQLSKDVYKHKGNALGLALLAKQALKGRYLGQNNDSFRVTPFQGLLFFCVPRALPWAKLFRPFRANRNKGFANNRPLHNQAPPILCSSIKKR